MLDRLLRHAQIVQSGAESCRFKNQREAGQRSHAARSALLVQMPL